MLTLLRRDRTTRIGILAIYGFGIPFLAADGSLPSLIVLGLILGDILAWGLAVRRDNRRQAAALAEFAAMRQEAYRKFSDPVLRQMISRPDSLIRHRDKD